MQRDTFQDWIDRYEQVWRTPGTDGLSGLFAEQIRYRPSPWAPPVVGLTALARFWDDERDGPDERFTFTAEPVAVDGDTGVARVQVHYAHGRSWRDLWVVRLGADGRCVEFEEWPFAPEDDDGHGSAPGGAASAPGASGGASGDGPGSAGPT